MKNVFISIAFIAVCNAAVADTSPGRYTDASTIKKLVSSIPMEDKEFGYKSLAERLPNLGLEVTMVEVYAMTKEEVASSKGIYKQGDFEYRFTMTRPHRGLLAICPMWPTFEFIKRGTRWIPSTRTSVFLVRNRCDTPNL